MNYLQLLNNVKARCSINQESQFDADIRMFLNDGQREISSRYTWRFLQAEETITTVAGTADYALANSCLVMNVRDTTNGVSLNPLDTLDFDRYYPLQTATGVARYYRLFGEDQADGSSGGTPVISFYPVPGGTYVLKVREYLDIPDMSADTDVSPIPVRYHGALVHYAAAAHFSSRGDARSAEHEARFENALASMAEQLAAEPADMIHVLRSENTRHDPRLLQYSASYPAE